jgi:hypothetical protein
MAMLSVGAMVPIAEMDRLLLDAAVMDNLAPYYVDVQPDILRLQVAPRCTYIVLNDKRVQLTLTVRGAFACCGTSPLTQKRVRQVIVDKLKSIGGAMKVAIIKCGDIHLQVEAAGAKLAVEMRGLSVAPAAMARESVPPR